MSGVQIPYHPPFPPRPGLPPLFVLRHGETEWNRAGRLQGSLDSALTPLGRVQAAAQGAILARAGVGPATHDMWCSPQGRAVATAAIALAAVRGAALLRPDLHEVRLGGMEGRTMTELRAAWPSIFDDADPLGWYFRTPCGETRAAIQTRAARVLTTVARPTVIVTHGITSRVLRGLVLGADPLRLDTPGGDQGVVFHLAGGRETVLD